MARARKTSKHISDNKPMKKSVKVLHFRNAEASEQREFIRKRKRDEMERIPHESFELKWCLDFIDDLIVDVTVIHDNFSKTLKKRYKVIQNETSSGAQNLCHCEIISDPKCLGMSEIALPSILETDNSTTEDVEEKVRMKETLDDLNLSLKNFQFWSSNL